MSTPKRWQDVVPTALCVLLGILSGIALALTLGWLESAFGGSLPWHVWLPVALAWPLVTAIGLVYLERVLQAFFPCVAMLIGRCLGGARPRHYPW